MTLPLFGSISSVFLASSIFTESSVSTLSLLCLWKSAFRSPSVRLSLGFRLSPACPGFEDGYDPLVRFDARLGLPGADPIHDEECALCQFLRDFRRPSGGLSQFRSYNPFVCYPCNYGVANQSNSSRHYKTERHRENMERIRAEKAKAKEEAAGPADQPPSSGD